MFELNVNYYDFIIINTTILINNNEDILFDSNVPTKMFQIKSTNYFKYLFTNVGQKSAYLFFYENVTRLTFLL